MHPHPGLKGGRDHEPGPLRRRLPGRRPRRPHLHPLDALPLDQLRQVEVQVDGVQQPREGLRPPAFGVRPRARAPDLHEHLQVRERPALEGGLCFPAEEPVPVEVEAGIDPLGVGATGLRAVDAAVAVQIPLGVVGRAVERPPALQGEEGVAEGPEVGHVHGAVAPPPVGAEALHHPPEGVHPQVPVRGAVVHVHQRPLDGLVAPDEVDRQGGGEGVHQGRGLLALGAGPAPDLREHRPGRPE